MNINRVTISGADNLVSKDEMLYTQQVFPFVEWGILVSTKRMGTNRYPSLEWIKNLHPELNVSFHLCGDICRDYVSGGDQWNRLAYENNLHHNRVQLNFSFKEDKDYTDELFAIGTKAILMRKYKRSLILAYNKGSKKNLDTFLNALTEVPDNLHLLYDSSGGRGTEIKSFNKPLRTYTGYAGGISPNNAFVICDTLSNMEWQDNIWIDMESGVRTNDVFDMQKVNDVLATANKFINQPSYP